MTKATYSLTESDSDLQGAAKAQYDHLVERLEETLSDTRAPGLRMVDRLNAVMFVAHLYAKSVAITLNEKRITKQDSRWLRARKKNSTAELLDSVSTKERIQ